MGTLRYFGIREGSGRGPSEREDGAQGRDGIQEARTRPGGGWHFLAEKKDSSYSDMLYIIQVRER